jgi:hypothetical protein
MNPPNPLRSACSASEILAVPHWHLGQVEAKKGLSVLLGILTAKSRRVELIETITEGNGETVALNIDPHRFMVTIGGSFILVTLHDENGRRPVIQKSWKRTERRIGTGLSAQFGNEDTYIDKDQLRWVHRYNRGNEFDELSAMDAEGEEALHIVLETFR